VSIYTIAFVTQILNERSLVQFPEDRSLQIPSRRYCRSCSFPRLLWNQRKKIHHDSHSTCNHFVWSRDTQCKLILFSAFNCWPYLQTADILRMRERYQVVPQVQSKRTRAKIHEDSPDITDTQKRMSRLKMV
jgi:hypothetical protein